MKFEYQDYKIITNKEFKFNYSILHSALNQYYPVGIRSTNEKYKTHLGYMSLEQVIVRNIESPNLLNKQWNKGFLKKVSNLTNFFVKEATFGYSPNYGGEIVLEESENLRYTTKLMFFVSFIYNYFSIKIVYTDKFVTYQREHLSDKTGFGIRKIVVSPVKGKYEELFKKVEILVREEFENAIFVPFRFDITKLKDFELPISSSEDFSTPISMAFFHKGKLLNGGTEIIGDIDYKIDEIKTNHNNV